MPTPVLHVIAGPNGAGKTTFFERILGPATGLPFINADWIEQERWLDLLRAAGAAGYRRYLYVILIPEELALARVAVRVETGGHDVPEEKIRGRFRRLWSLLRDAVELVEEADNSRAGHPFRLVARFSEGRLLGSADWPSWTPRELFRVR